MYINAEKIITAISLIIAISTIIGSVLKIHKWYLKQQAQDLAIVKIEKENALVYYGLSACLDGLMQLGANHTVPKAKDKLDKYLNEQAHKYDT